MREPWTEEEDRILEISVAKIGYQDWKSVSTMVNRLSSREGTKWRCPKSCRQRWSEHLDPGISNDPLTEDEKERILGLHRRHGNQWALIARKLGNRSSNTVKNFWYNHRRKEEIQQGLEIGETSKEVVSREAGEGDMETEKFLFGTPVSTEGLGGSLGAAEKGLGLCVGTRNRDRPTTVVPESTPTSKRRLVTYATDMSLVRSAPRAFPASSGSIHPVYDQMKRFKDGKLSVESLSKRVDRNQEETLELLGSLQVPQNPYQPR